MKLSSDSVFIYPTDTVWGIGSSIYSQNAYKRIAQIKKTSDDKPLSIMFGDINTLYKSFNFPGVFSLSWLRNYFKLESTLVIPVKISKISIPAWAIGPNGYVSIRCVDLPVIKQIATDLNAPFFTTSLNLTGEPPITSYTDAKAFLEAHAKDASLFGGEGEALSGASSTIVFFLGDRFEIKREGKNVNEIKKLLVSTGLKVS